MGETDYCVTCMNPVITCVCVLRPLNSSDLAKATMARERIEEALDKAMKEIIHLSQEFRDATDAESEIRAHLNYQRRMNKE